MDETLAYLDAVLARVVERLAAREPSPADHYFHLLTIFHEDMHTEAFTYTRQTLAYPAPLLDGNAGPADDRAGPWPGDVVVPGGRFLLGATAEEPFVFDNEKWAHPVELRPFAVARAPVL